MTGRKTPGKRKKIRTFFESMAAVDFDIQFISAINKKFCELVGKQRNYFAHEIKLKS